MSQPFFICLIWLVTKNLSEWNVKQYQSIRLFEQLLKVYINIVMGLAMALSLPLTT